MSTSQTVTCGLLACCRIFSGATAMKVVNDDDIAPAAFADQAVQEMAADEAGSAGNDRFHKSRFHLE